jgi:hypothetical protein
MRGDIETTGQSNDPFVAMIHSARRDRKAKAIAEALAMLANAHPEFDPHRPRHVRETDKWL